MSSIDLFKIGDWISLSSAYHNFILKDTLYREQEGRVWKMSHFDLVKAIPDLPSTILLYTLAAFDCFFSYFNLIVYSPAILPCSQNWEKAHREWQFWLEGQLIMVEGRRWGSFQRMSFSSHPVLVETV